MKTVTKELKDKTEKELKDTLKEAKGKLLALQFKVATKELKNIREIRETKKTVARILTLISKKDKK